MAVVKFTKANKLKSYVYRSRAKVDLLYQQVQRPKPKKTLKWKMDAWLVSAEAELESPTEITDQQKLDTVVEALEKSKLVGSPEERREYIRGTLPMRWGIFDDAEFRPTTDGPLVYFGGIGDRLLLGLGGSSLHIGNPYGIGGTGSRSYTPILYRWLRSGLDSGQCPPLAYHDEPDPEEYQIAEAMAIANRYLTGPIQQLEFVAKVLWRGEGYKLRPYDNDERGEVILGTPLYVAQVLAKPVDA